MHFFIGMPDKGFGDTDVRTYDFLNTQVKHDYQNYIKRVRYKNSKQGWKEVGVGDCDVSCKDVGAGEYDVRRFDVAVGDCDVRYEDVRYENSLERLKMKIASLEKTKMFFKKRYERLREKNTRMNAENSDLKKQMRYANMKKRKIETVRAFLEETGQTPSQIKKILRPEDKYIKNWTSEEVCQVIKSTAFYSAMWIRIRIQTPPWIRIRNLIGIPDSDPKVQK